MSIAMLRNSVSHHRRKIGLENSPITHGTVIGISRTEVEKVAGTLWIMEMFKHVSYGDSKFLSTVQP